MKIVPTLFSYSIDEMQVQYKTLSPYFSYFHIDIITSDFIQSANDTISKEQLSYLLSQLQQNSHTCEIHFMSKPSSIIDFENTIKQYQSQIQSIILHFEAFDSNHELEEFVQYMRNNYSRMQIQLAISPHTQFETTLSCISLFDQIMIMGVVPGKQCQNLIFSRLNLVKLLRSLNITQISLDGGVNNETISTIATHSFSQINVGSYINSAQDIENNITKLENTVKLEDKSIENDTSINDITMCICHIDTHSIKYYVGTFEHFSTQECREVQDFKYSTLSQFLQSIILSIHADTILLFGDVKHEETTQINNNNMLTIDMKKIRTKYYKTKIYWRDTCEITAYGLKAQKRKGVTKSEENIDNLTNYNTKVGIENNYLEILVTFDSCVKLAHISNSNVVYKSLGESSIVSIDDYKYLDFLKAQKKSREISFEDILSIKGLEMRYFYDTSMYLSYVDILSYAQNKEYSKYTLTPTISFFIQELYYFLLDCIYFDNIITTLYINSEVLSSCMEIMRRDYPKLYTKLSRKCRIEILRGGDIQFLGALEFIYSSFRT